MEVFIQFIQNHHSHNPLYDSITPRLLTISELAYFNNEIIP